MVLQNAHSGVLAAEDGAIRTLPDFALANQGLSTQERARIDSALIAAVSDRSAFFTTRESGVRALSDVVRADRHLSPDVKARFHRAMRLAVSDSVADVRQEAVSALGDFGDPSDLPLLQQIAARDTAHAIHAGRQKYFVREEAQRAIGKLSARTSSAPPQTSSLP